MRGFIAVLVLASLAPAGTGHRLGVTGGFPQMAAVAYQYTPFDYTTLEVFTGTLIINGALGGRVILSRTAEGISPRMFTGVCVFDQWYSDSPDCPKGITSYLWSGAGLGWNFPGGFTVFGDLSWLTGGDLSRGLGYNRDLLISGGLLFSL